VLIAMYILFKDFIPIFYREDLKDGHFGQLLYIVNRIDYK